jgi:hypothetical membrane protein
MTIRARLAFGPLAALILLLGMGMTAAMVPGYDAWRQTVSEIGEVGSPARLPFAVLLCGVGLCLLVFASAIRDLARARDRSVLAAYFIAFMALPAAGIGIFAYPHPLHNWFGMAELVGYQAPLVLAVTWRGDARRRDVVVFSWGMFALVSIAILLNLSTFHRQGALWAAIRPVYGVVQRSLFAAWFIWCSGLGLLLRRQEAAGG